MNKESSKISVQREFAAALNLVWEAWTNPEILDQWWAPKPFRNKTKVMEFKPGGMWLYGMISPQEEIFWCKSEFENIEHQNSFSYTDNFCDENGEVKEKFPNSLWTNVFVDNATSCTVNITIQFENLDSLERIIEMGFKEGFSMAMENLDQLLENNSIR